MPMHKSNLSLSFFLAWRYVYSAASKSSLSTMTYICFLSILVGSFSLALVSAITKGFESTLHEKLRGIHSHITLQSDEELAVDAINTVITAEFPEIHSTALRITKHALVYAPHTQSAPLVAIINGIDAMQEQKTSSLASKIIVGASVLEHSVHDQCVLIGKEMASQLEVTIGDTLTLAYSDDLSTQRRSITFDTQELIVSGIFETGLEEVDTNYIFCDYHLLQALFQDAKITTLHVSLKKGFDEESIAQKMEQRFSLHAYSWKSLYPALISALALEKYAAFWILALITLVASANIIALLYMIITQKKSDIALLRTMGASHGTIRMIFIIIGTSIAQCACTIGIILAWLTSFCINHFKLITLPDSYYTAHLPAEMSFAISCAVFVLVGIMSLGATFIATKNIYQGNIAEIMRN